MASSHRIDPLLLFRSAILNADGTVNVGYLTLFRLFNLLLFVIGILTALLGLEVWAWWQGTVHDPAVLKDLGKDYALACGIAAGSVFGPALGACGIFLWGDSKTSNAPATSSHVVGG